MIFDFKTLTFSRLDSAVSDWCKFRDLLSAPDLSEPHRRIYEERLKEARVELDHARGDLNQQRKREIEAWAKVRGLNVNWSKWDRTTG